MKGLLFNKEGLDSTLTINISCEYDEVNCIIDALLDALLIPDDLQSKEERFYICKVIRALLPSDEQLQQLSDQQLKKKKIA